MYFPTSKFLFKICSLGASHQLSLHESNASQQVIPPSLMTTHVMTAAIVNAFPGSFSQAMTTKTTAPMKSALYFAALVVALADTSTNTQVLENKQVPIQSVEPPHELQVPTLPVENDDAFSPSFAPSAAPTSINAMISRRCRHQFLLSAIKILVLSRQVLLLFQSLYMSIHMCFSSLVPLLVT